jgi:putative sterol carrier protein
MSAPAAVLADVVKRFRPEAAEGLNAVYQLHLTGEGGGVWHVSVANKQCHLSPGPATEADVTVAVSVEDWGEMVAGRLEAVTAFFSGRVQVSGDLGLVARLKDISGF